MSGWDLAEGICNNKCQNENEFWLIINNVLSNKTNKTTSYKYGFFKSILDNIFNFNQENEIDYETVFERFAEIYWNLVIKYDLCQIQATSTFSKSSVEIILENIFKKYPLDKAIAFENLNDEVKKETIKAVSKECSKYVVGAFYSDTNGAFYSFNRKKGIIKFAPNIIEYFIKYKNVLGKLNYFEWIKFLEKTNVKEKAFSLAEKLDNSSKRGNLSYYRDFLQDIYGESKCFYCGKNLLTQKIEMDHFIPWSYIKDDKIWNMVMACRDCNNSKRDKLAGKKYIDKLVEQNNKIMNGPYFKAIQREYAGYNDESLIKIYNSAIFNGFNENWKPKEKN